MQVTQAHRFLSQALQPHSIDADDQDQAKVSMGESEVRQHTAHQVEQWQICDLSSPG